MIAITTIDRTPAEILADIADTWGQTPWGVIRDEDAMNSSGLTPVDVTKEVVEEATRIFHKRIRQTLERAERFNNRYLHQTKAPVEVAKEITKERRVVKPVRAKIFGYSVTAVLRWMGKNGWGFDEAALAVTTLTQAYHLSDTTIRLQLKAGKDGLRGDPAPITTSQAKTLRAAAQ